MISSSYQDSINRIEKDIADYYSKISDESKREIDKSKQIDSIRRSITSSTSISTIQSKERQILSYQSDILDIKRKLADYQKKISEKNIDLGRKKQDLRRAEEAEFKKNQKERLDFQRHLEDQIAAQKEQLDILIRQTYSSNSSNNGVVSIEEEKEYDFFISHATEDKEDFVRELANALSDDGIKVWYDEFVLRVGDSLRKRIDDGLVRSKYGIVIISPSFISKNWTEYELNGMIAKEMNGHKVVLPIWHKVTKDEVLKYSPSLADKMALNTAIHSMSEIVTALKEILNEK